MSLFVCRPREGRGLPTVLTGGDSREDDEILRPETTRLITQLELVIVMSVL